MPALLPNPDARRWLQGLCLGCLAVAVAPGAPARGEPAGAPASAPFAERSGPRGATLFTTLRPEQTGLTATNAYDDPAMWGERYHEFNAGAIGTGVAVGDFDGDGRPDIFMVCKTGPNHLYRNLGGFRFEDVTARAGVAGPTGPWKQGAAFADVNNDGRLDLYVCRFGAPNLLYINQGDGTFREEAAARGLALTDASNMAAFCDYDRDGWLDVYVQTNLLDAARHPGGQRDHLFHNNRDGTFTDVTDAAGIAGETQGHSATWWDYDEDGWPDLYVANDFSAPDQLYHNNRDGTFTDVLSAVVPHTPHFSMGSDVGDLNNDGHPDLMVADMPGATREADYRGMARLRSALPDDRLYPRAAPQYMRNALYLGTGTGRVLEAAELAGLPAAGWAFGVRFEDVDLDGRLDVVITNGMVREFTNADLVARSLGAASPADRARVLRSSPVLTETHLAFRNEGDLQFADVSAAWGLDQRGVAFGSAFGDFDGDGDLDLVYANYDAPPTVCRNDADTGHAVEFELRGRVSNRFGIGATLRLTSAHGRQLRTLTLARGYLSTSEPIVHFGLGSDGLIDELVVEWPSGRRQVLHALAADRRYTLVEPDQDAYPSSPAAATLFNEVGQPANLAAANHERPGGGAATLLPFRLDRPGPAAACADLDGDGEDDLAVGGVTGEPGQLLSNLGGGQFIAYGSNLLPAAARAADGPILAIDVDADGDLDLLVTKTGATTAGDEAGLQPRLLLNDGRGHFSAAPADLLPPLPLCVGAAVAADFERSGRPGIFLGGRFVPGRFPQAPRSALLAWRAGRYRDVTAEVGPELASRGMVTAALWSDVDGDGWPDLLVAYDWGPVACYRNDHGRRFEDATARLGFAGAGTGWWRSLAAADFNGDGRPDFVAGNTGLNTRYHASAAAPAVLYAGVVLDGSAPGLVEAEYADGRWYPLRPLDLLARAFPSLAHRFSSMDAYARATLDEVFPAPVLAAASRLQATELRSGVFLSQPDGTYRFAPLPRLAQIAPVHGLAAGDFDGDGRADILLVGNSYAPIPETGRFDGGVGWLLRGDGHGGFATVPPAESGFIVPGDARALVVIDLNQDGWPDAFVTRNNDFALAFLHRRLPGRHLFSVALRGQPGNPAALGARMRLELADGSTQCAELAAGSGYFSQSGASLYFGYPDNAPPKRLEVRWPDGRVTTHDFAAPPPSSLRLSSP